MEVWGEILVVPFFGQGHLFPSMELCKHLSSHKYQATLIIPSHLSSSIPSSLRSLSLIGIVEIPNSPPSPPPPPPLSVSEPGSGPGPNPFRKHHERMGSGLEDFLFERCKDPTRNKPICAVLDVMMSWSKEFFGKFGIQTVSFFTSGASSAAIQYASWKEHAVEMKPGEIRKFPGLPEEMKLSYFDVQMEHRHRPIRHGSNHPMDRPDGSPPGGMKFGPPGPGDRPRWLEEVEGSTALLFNTCESLELPFLNYIAEQIEKPVYGVGPLLPEQYWKSTGSIIHDGQVRSNRESNYTEEQVIQWLDSRPRRSVIYVSFGSEVGPSLEEYAELADALGELNRAFIWVIQPNAGRHGPPPGFAGEKSDSRIEEEEEESYYPHGLKEKTEEKGLIIKGWAPQLLILSHPSVGGFVSHCGWNSTVESIGRGVPILAWPIRGDQFVNAKLAVKYLKVGHSLLFREEEEDDDDPAPAAQIMVKKEKIVRGIGCLLDDKELAKRAEELSWMFSNGFPASSVAALKSFVETII